MIKGLIQEEEITIVNIYAPNIAALQYIKQILTAIKRNEIESLVVRWMDLESAIQSEVSQKEKNKYHMLTHI